jgi:hypothetical protein
MSNGVVDAPILDDAIQYVRDSLLIDSSPAEPLIVFAFLAEAYTTPLYVRHMPGMSLLLHSYIQS